MRTGAKLAAFASAALAVFAGALGVGAAVGPIDVGDPTHEMADAPSAAGLPGLSIAADGHRFVPATTSVPPGANTSYAFTIVDDDGEPLTEYATLHERPLHLIVLSRNLVDYHHLHPTLGADGRWSVELPPLSPGSHRVFADFQPAGGDNLTLAADLDVPGEVPLAQLPAPASSAAVDGYVVELDAHPAVGESELHLSVSLDGAQVETEPYLGAAGHLVVIRNGDLAYLHVHPVEGHDAMVTFAADFPSAGTYRLFFDFAHGGVVRTAAFTVEIAP